MGVGVALAVRVVVVVNVGVQDGVKDGVVEGVGVGLLVILGVGVGLRHAPGLPKVLFAIPLLTLTVIEYGSVSLCVAYNQYPPVPFFVGS